MPKTLMLLAIAILLPAVAHAQWVPGVGDDASLPQSGTVRVGISAQLHDYDRRFSRSGDGTLEPLGSDFGVYPVERLPDGSATQERIRALAGVPNLTLTLGDLDVRRRGRVERVPMTLELGVLRRLAFGVVIPFVRTRSTVIIGPGLGTGATAGINPALTTSAALAQNTTLNNALAAANQELRNRLASCAGSSDPSCNAVNSDRAAAEAFVQSSEAFKQNFEVVYLSSRVVPVGMSPADQAVAARLTSMRSQFETYGVTSLSAAPARPVPAAPIAVEDLQALITTEPFGILTDPLVTVERTSVGDVEAGGKLLLIDGIDPNGNRPLGVRLLAGGTVRLGTGSAELIHNLVDIGTGDGQTDVEGLVVLDLVFGRRIALTATARHTRQLEDEPTLRIPQIPGQVIIAAVDTARVARDLGDITAFEAVPRLAINEFMAIAGYYSFRRKGADRHEQIGGAISPDLNTTGPFPNARLLDVGTEFREQRVGFGIGFANLAAYRRGRARFPYEISYLHMRTTRASGGLVPRVSEDRLQLKLYVPLWGR